MSRAEPAVFTNMCMVEDGNGNVLMQRRFDPDWPGLVFPGGHVNPGESFVESVVREVWEETGITVLNPVLCGVTQFQDSCDNRYVVLLYRADRYEGELRSSEEGEAMWVPRSGLECEKCAPGFTNMLPVFETPSLSELFYPDRNDENMYRLL